MIMKEFAKIPYKKEESFDKLDKSWSDYDPFDLSISHDFSWVLLKYLFIYILFDGKLIIENWYLNSLRIPRVTF